MRWRQSVGVVYWCRTHPNSNESWPVASEWSGDVGLVREKMWDFLNGKSRVRVRVRDPTQQIFNLALAVSRLRDDLISAR